MMLLLVSYNLRALEGTESARSKRSSRKPPAGGDGVPHAMTHGLVALCFRMKPVSRSTVASVMGWWVGWLVGWLVRLVG